MKRWVLWLASLCALLFSARAEAHARSVSYSTWQLDGRHASVVARISLLDLSVLERAGFARGSPALLAHVQKSLTLSSPAGACRAAPARERAAGPEWLDLEWTLDCASEGLWLESTLLIEQNPSHLHLAKVSFGSGPATEHVLDERATKVSLSTAAAPGGFSRFVLLGVEHIATGWDHLLFVLMLLVSAETLRRTAWVVTGFTLGHSITLTLTTLGALVPHEGPVEALIALSIALLAVENVWLAEGRRSRALPLAAVGAVMLAALAASSLAKPVALSLLGVAMFAACYFALVERSARPELGRAAIAGLFGLIHGFGFARVLTAMELPAARQARALLGFNLGVELGQLALVALAWPVLAALKRRRESAELTRLAASVALGLACYWFVARAFSG